MDATIDKYKLIKELKAYHSFNVFPDGLNYFGSLFGGKVLAEMDVVAAKAVRKLLNGTDCDGAATISIDKVDFKRPAYVGDLIELEAEIVALGNTSIKVKINVIKEDAEGRQANICEAYFNFISFKEKRPFPHACKLI